MTFEEDRGELEMELNYNELMENNKLINKRIIEELEILNKKLCKEYKDMCSSLCNGNLPDWFDEGAQLVMFSMIKMILNGPFFQDHKITPPSDSPTES